MANPQLMGYGTYFKTCPFTRVLQIGGRVKTLTEEVVAMNTEITWRSVEEVKRSV